MSSSYPVNIAKPIEQDSVHEITNTDWQTDKHMQGLWSEYILIYMYMYISVPNAGKLPAEAQTIYKRTIGLFANREADRK